MENQEEKRYLKRCNLLIAVCMALYVTMMAAKGMYSAEIIQIMEVFNVDKANASLATSYYFLTYAVMQLLLTLVFKKVSVKIYTLITVALSGLATLLVAFMTNISGVWVIFAINGILQAGIWSGCIGVLGKYLPKSRLVRANSIMSSGFPFGTAISYGVCSACVAIERWDLPFIISGVALIIAVAVFFAIQVLMDKNLKKTSIAAVEEYCLRFDETRRHGKKQPSHVSDKIASYIMVDTPKNKIFFYAFMAMIGFFSSFYYYGVMNWVPSLLKEIYHFDDSISIVISMVFPFCMLIGPALAINFCEKHNFIKVGIITMSVAGIVALALTFAYNVNVVLAIAMLIVGLILEKSFRPVFSSVLILKMRDKINVGGVSAYVNSFGSCAAAAAPPVVGLFIDNVGWSVGYLCVAIAALISAGLIFIWSKRIKNEMKKEKLLSDINACETATAL